MARESYVWDRELRDLVPADEYYAKQRKGVKKSRLPSPMVMGDIKEFVNVAVDGKVISSRSQKREMMKEHGLVEVGNDRLPTRTRHKPKRSDIRAAMKKSLQQLGA